MPFKPLRAQPVADGLGAARIPPASLQQPIKTADHLGLQLELLGAGLRAERPRRSSKRTAAKQMGGGGGGKKGSTSFYANLNMKAWSLRMFSAGAWAR